MITHDPYLAVKYSDRIVLMQEGSITADIRASTTPKEVFQKYIEYVYMSRVGEGEV